jgi:proline dehydrogenase
MTSAIQRKKSKSFSLVDLLPLNMVRHLASPYIAGNDSPAAITLAHELFEKHGIFSNFDILGEDVSLSSVADNYVTIYRNLIDALVGQKLQVEDMRKQISISMKPSMFSVTSPRPGRMCKLLLDETFDRIAQVVDYAFRNGVNMTLEAEDRRWTNFQLETYFALVQAGYTNLGTVLQTRLFRTAKDIERFDDKTRVRLVIGIYEEPAAIAYTDKRQMKSLLVDFAGKLLANGAYVELATHDSHYLQRFFAEIAIPRQLSTSRFETQFLLGVPREKLQAGLVNGSFFQSYRGSQYRNCASYLDALTNGGVLVRMYLPFGAPHVAGPYCKRRLRENHNLILYGIKNILHWT